MPTHVIFDLDNTLYPHHLSVVERVDVLITGFVRERLGLDAAAPHPRLPQAGGTLISHHFSHDELARMVGATRSWVTVAIRNLKKESIIACRGRHIIVVDRTALQKVVNAQRPHP